MNSFKSFVKNIADKAGSEFSPVRGASTPDDAAEPGLHLDEEQEGFICPSCMRGFRTPDLLQVHYESEHSLENTITVAKRSEGKYADLEDTVNTMRSALKEEISYSAELKKEVEMLGSALKGNKSGDVDNQGNNGDSKLEEEKQMYQEQVRALQEGKTLLSQEVLSLRQELARNELPAKEKEKLIEKAADLAAENVSLKAMNDEIQGQKIAVEERLKLVQDELYQKNSTDDAAVLRQELVSVQTMMDELTLQKEQELSNLQGKYEILEKENENLKQTQRSGQSEIAKNLSALQKDKMELEKQVEQLTEQLDKQRSDLSQSESTCKNLTSSIEESRLDFEHKLREWTEEKFEIQSKNSESLHNLNSELEKLKNHLSSQEGKSGDLVQELSSVQTHYDDQCRLNDDLKTQVNELKLALSESQRTLDNRLNELNDLNKSVASLKAELARKDDEKVQLLAKIEEGEGASTALTQLKTQNQDLQNEIENMKSSQSAVLSRKNSELDDVHKRCLEAQQGLDKFRDKTSKLEQSLQEKQKKIENLDKTQTKLETELQGKNELLAAAEAARIAERKDLEGHVHLAQTNMEAKERELQKSESSLKETQSQLNSEKDKLSKLTLEKSELNHQLDSSRSKIQEISQKLKELDNEKQAVSLSLEKEKQAKDELASELSDLQTKYSELNASSCNLDKQNASLESQLSASQVSFKKSEEACKGLTAKLKNREEDLQTLNKSLADSSRREQDLKSDLKQSQEKEKILVTTLDDQVAVMNQFKKETAAKLEANGSQLAALETELAASRTEISGISTQRDESEREKAQLVEEICRLQSSYEKSNLQKDEQIQDLQRAKEVLLTSKIELQKEIDNLNQKIKVHLDMLDKAENTHRNEISKLETEIGNLKQELVSASALHESTMKAHKSTQEKLDKSIEDLESKLTLKQEELVELEQKHQELNNQLDSALSDKLELEAQIGSASDERKILLERCLGAEAELERSRSNLIEFRRKLDDSQAALHELGRENQSIQVELAKQSGRKWADDSEVTNCKTCRLQFSLTNRKHHCRNCGQIFCNDCSSKQANMPNYKKPQRVCDQCHGELLQQQVN